MSKYSSPRKKEATFSWEIEGSDYVRKICFKPLKKGEKIGFGLGGKGQRTEVVVIRNGTQAYWKGVLKGYLVATVNGKEVNDITVSSALQDAVTSGKDFVIGFQVPNKPDWADNSKAAAESAMDGFLGTPLDDQPSIKEEQPQIRDGDSTGGMKTAGKSGRIGSRSSRITRGKDRNKNIKEDIIIDDGIIDHGGPMYDDGNDGGGAEMFLGDDDVDVEFVPRKKKVSYKGMKDRVAQEDQKTKNTFVWRPGGRGAPVRTSPPKESAHSLAGRISRRGTKKEQHVEDDIKKEEEQLEKEKKLKSALEEEKEAKRWSPRNAGSPRGKRSPRQAGSPRRAGSPRKSKNDRNKGKNAKLESPRKNRKKKTKDKKVEEPEEKVSEGGNALEKVEEYTLEALEKKSKAELEKLEEQKAKEYQSLKEEEDALRKLIKNKEKELREGATREVLQELKELRRKGKALREKVKRTLEELDLIRAVLRRRVMELQGSMKDLISGSAARDQKLTELERKVANLETRLREV